LGCTPLVEQVDIREMSRQSTLKAVD
jgi:hypothetical protein